MSRVIPRVVLLHPGHASTILRQRGDCCMPQAITAGPTGPYGSLIASPRPEPVEGLRRTAVDQSVWNNPGAQSVKRVLIIDNEAGLVQALRQNLELEGHEVLVEPEGIWGVAQATKFQPDLVITDLTVLEAGDHGLLDQLRS